MGAGGACDHAPGAWGGVVARALLTWNPSLGWGSNVADPEPAVQALACEVAAPNIREGARTEVAGVLARLLTRVVSV